MQTTSITQLGNEHSGWKSALGFYKDELGVYKNRLTEIAGKNTGREVMQQVEHFQNQFLVHIESIDTLNHDINSLLNEMAGAVQEHAGHVSHAQLEAHSRLKEQFETEERIFKELKQDFALFAAMVM